MPYHVLENTDWQSLPVSEVQQASATMSESSEQNLSPSSTAQASPWTITADGIATSGSESYAIDFTKLQEGKASLRLISDGRRVTLSSNQFQSPPTGRLTLLFWIGVPVADDKLSALECTLTRPAIRVGERPGMVCRIPGAIFPAPVTEKVEDGVRWRRFVLPVTNLPLEEPIDMTVNFTLNEKSTAWIDDVQLYGLSFTRRERIELLEIVSLADYDLRKGTRRRLHETARFLLAAIPHAICSRAKAGRSSR